MDPYFQPDCSAAGAQGTRLSANSTRKREAPPGPALLGNGGDRVPVALERKPGLADQEKAMQSDESLRPRTPTPSSGPPFHSPAHAHTHKHEASKFHFVWLVCPRSHLATFPVTGISTPSRVPSFQVTKGKLPVKGSSPLFLELLTQAQSCLKSISQSLASPTAGACVSIPGPLVYLLVYILKAVSRRPGGDVGTHPLKQTRLGEIWR